MKILVDELNEFYSENIRLAKTLMQRESLKEYPQKFKWKLQMLYFDGSKWIEVCRIDNYPHENIVASHMHLYGKEEVKWLDIDYSQADATIKDISSKIIRERFHTPTDFEG